MEYQLNIRLRLDKTTKELSNERCGSEILLKFSLRVRSTISRLLHCCQAITTATSHVEGALYRSQCSPEDHKRDGKIISGTKKLAKGSKLYSL